MQQLVMTVTIDVDGRHVADVVDDLLIDADAGELDQAALDLLRQHLRKIGDFRDYRIVRCTVTVPEGR